jgi:hypothetical protein
MVHSLALAQPAGATEKLNTHIGESIALPVPRYAFARDDHRRGHDR